MVELKMGDSEVSFGASERPKYQALRSAINGMFRDLLRPLTRLEEQTYLLLGLPTQKADAFRYTAAMRRTLDEALDLYLTEIAGPDRSREGFVNGGPDADTPDGVLQQWERFSFAVGLRRGADLVGRPQTLSAERNSPAVRSMLDSAFTRLSEGGRLKLEGIRDEVHSILTSATAAGLSPLDTGRQLAGLYSDYNRVQFDRLARTESAFAAEEASRLQMADLGVTHVTWLISAGACPICQSFVGLVIPIEDVDRQPPGASHPNCLCSTVPATADDAAAAAVETVGPQTGEEAAEAILKLDEALPEQIRQENLAIQARENDLYEEHSLLMRRRSSARIAGDDATADSITPQLEKLSRDIDKLTKQREALKVARLERLREAVAVENPITVETKFVGPTRIGRPAIREGMAGFERLVDQRVVDQATNPRAQRVFVNKPNIPGHEKRSYHQGGEIYMATGAKASITVHEMGHWLEHNSHQVREASQRFLARRTAGESTVRLKDLFPNSSYDVSEITRPDKFIDPYIGKDYGDRASEVVSMGLQYMFEDPAAFARRDPDHFAFIWDTMRGRFSK